MRTLALTLAATCTIFSTANAQQFLLQAGSGATLVGDTFFVQPGQNFTVRTILDMQGTSISSQSVLTALAFQINGSSVNKLNFVSGVHNTDITSIMPVFPNANSDFFNRTAALANPANYSSAQGFLPRVIYTHYISPPSVPTLPVLSGTYTINDITFVNSLTAGEIYGDAANETGLFLAHQIPNGQSTQLGGSGITFRRFGSPKYKVQAVPEPATMTVLALGLAAIARRRKTA